MHAVETDFLRETQHISIAIQIDFWRQHCNIKIDSLNVTVNLKYNLFYKFHFMNWNYINKKLRQPDGGLLDEIVTCSSMSSISYSFLVISCTNSPKSICSLSAVMSTDKHYNVGNSFYTRYFLLKIITNMTFVCIHRPVGDLYYESFGSLNQPKRKSFEQKQ